MRPGKSNVIGDFVERHSRVWRALAEAGVGTNGSGPVLETGHHAGVYCNPADGEWFARLVNFAGPEPEMTHVVRLGTDDDAVPERLKQALATPEVMEYLRASMR